MKRIISMLLIALLLFPATVFAKTELPFVDVPEDSWYFSAVKFDYVNYLIDGVSEISFEPDTELTREAFVMLLAKLGSENLNQYEGKTSFEDVEVGKWYSAAIEWAKQNGITSGLSDTLFGLEQGISREQTATMLYNYAVCKKYDVTKTSDLSQFEDKELISDWAIDGIKYAVGNDLMEGMAKTVFSPKTFSCRAQAAMLIYRFYYRIKYHADIPETSYADSVQIKEDNTPRIVCWGDSLTQGLGSKTPYPDLIEQITGVETVNMGIASETAELIAMRQGGIPVYAVPGTIPATTDEVDYEFNDDYDNPSYIGVYGKYERGINDISINGISGKVHTGDFDSTFTRTLPGAELTLTKPTRIVTTGMADRRTGDISVFFLGANNKYAAVDSPELVKIINRMVRYCGNDRYVVVSLTPKCMLPDLDYTNQLLKDAYGEHYVPFREYIITDALYDLGITPTEQDMLDLKKGEIPESLRSDNCHGNQLFYDICAAMISEKITELGYLD